MLKIIFFEFFAKNPVERIPEERIVMTDAERVQQFTVIGDPGGDMTPLYYYRLTNLAKTLQSGDKVLDLGCGSGQLLLLIAQNFPDIEFVGIDLSENMLLEAEKIQKTKNIHNVKFVKADMTQLSEKFGLNTFDVVISTDALHHLPEVSYLYQTLKEVKKVLKNDGRFSFFDFDRVKTHLAMKLLVSVSNKNSGPLVLEDYYQSLMAAFNKEDFSKGILDAGLSNYSVLTTRPTFLMCFFTVGYGYTDVKNKSYKDVFGCNMSWEQKISFFLFKCFTKERQIH